VARNILSSRLQALVTAGILTREGTPARPTYALTKKGKALLPALLALMQWGDEWETIAPPMVVTDDTGEPLRPVVALTRSGRSLTADVVRCAPGPGANPRTRAFLTRREPRSRKRVR